MGDIENLLNACLDKNAEVRQNGENTIRDMRNTQPDSLAQGLVTGMAFPNDAQAGLAAVLFRSNFIEKRDIWDENRLPMAEQCKQAVNNLVTPERRTQLLKKYADVLVGLHEILETGSEFLGMVFNSFNSPNNNIKEFAMYCIELATECPEMMELLRAEAGAAQQMLAQGFNDADIGVRLHSVKSTACFLQGYSEEAQVMQFQPVMETLLNVMTEALSQVLNNAIDEDGIGKINRSFTMLAELTSTYPRLWTNYLDQFISFTVNTAKSQQLPENMRAAGVELIEAIMKKAPGVIRRSQNFVQEAITLGLTLLAELDHTLDINAWNMSEADPAVINTKPHSLGKSLITKIALYLKGETVLPLIFQLIPHYLNSDDWMRTHTGILTLGLIAEGCHNLYKENPGEVLNLIMPFTTAQHPRLRWAAMSSLKTLCDEFEPDMQTTFHAQIAPGILSCMTEGNLIKTQTQAASCMAVFGRGLVSDDESETLRIALSPYKQDLVNSLLNLLAMGLQSQSTALLEEVISCVSITASVLQEEFTPFYQQFMTGLKTLIGQQNGDLTLHQKKVRASCIESMGHLVEAVGDSCAADAYETFNMLISMIPGIDFTDPALNAIKEVSPLFASCLKEQFAPFISGIFQSLLSDAAINVSTYMIEAQEGQTEVQQQGITLTFEVHGQSKKSMVINAVEMQTKQAAVQLLVDMLQRLGPLADEMVEPIIQVVQPLLEYRQSEAIKKSAAKVLGTVLKCCASPEKAEILLRNLIPVFGNAISQTQEELAKQTKRLLNGLVDACESVQNVAVIGLPQAIELSALLANCVKNVFERKAERLEERQSYQDPEMFADELEELAEDENIDANIIYYVMKTVGLLLKGFKQQYAETFVNYFKAMYGQIFFQQDATTSEINYAICIFDDYMEHTGDVMVENGKSIILDELLKACTHSDADIRQSASYGVGLAATFMPQDVFSAYCQGALQQLHTIITAQDAHSEESASSTECAVSALGKIALAHCPDVIQNWLSYMPLKFDEDEAQSGNKFFLQNLPGLKGYPETMKVCSELQQMVQQPSNVQVLDEEGLSLLSSAQSILQS